MNVIREAAKRLPGHWYQGWFSDGDGNHCGLGHISEVAAEQNIVWGNTLEVLNAVAREQYPERVVRSATYPNAAFSEFNDHADTTEEEVVAVMEKAAVRLDETL
jgi:hypothetical protein